MLEQQCRQRLLLCCDMLNELPRQRCCEDFRPVLSMWREDYSKTSIWCHRTSGWYPQLTGMVTPHQGPFLCIFSKSSNSG